MALREPAHRQGCTTSRRSARALKLTSATDAPSRGRRGRRLGPGMAAADHDDVKCCARSGASSGPVPRGTEARAVRAQPVCRCRTARTARSSMSSTPALGRSFAIERRTRCLAAAPRPRSAGHRRASASFTQLKAVAKRRPMTGVEATLRLRQAAAKSGPLESAARTSSSMPGPGFRRHRQCPTDPSAVDQYPTWA